MEAIGLLEKRIDALTRLLGPMSEHITSAEQQNSGAPMEDVVDSMISAQTLLNGAVSGREQIEKAVSRAPELEKYMESDFIENNQKIRSKEVYLSAIAPDLHAQFEQLDQIKELEPALGAEYFRNIPGECTDKLKHVAQDNAEFAQQAELIEESLILAMKRYGEIQANLLKSLDTMNKRLEVAEDKLLKKKKDDLEKELPEKENPSK